MSPSWYCLCSCDARMAMVDFSGERENSVTNGRGVCSQFSELGIRLSSVPSSTMSLYLTTQRPFASMHFVQRTECLLLVKSAPFFFLKLVKYKTPDPDYCSAARSLLQNRNQLTFISFYAKADVHNPARHFDLSSKWY
jgi:hypothetical protein